MNKIIEYKHDIYHEDRGCIGVFFENNWYNDTNWPVDEHFNPLELIEDRFSKSYKGCVRGFHSDAETWKYITCLVGKIKLVTWNIKEQKRQEFYLEDGDKSVLIPPMVFNGHQCLSEVCVFAYKQSTNYRNFPAEKQYSVFYNDLAIQPNWDLEPRRVSERDKNAQTLAEFYKSLTETKL